MANPNPHQNKAPVQQSTLGLTQEQAEKLLKADVANIVKKVTSGRTLSAQERAILQTQTSSDAGDAAARDYVTNQKELADALGIHYDTLRLWFKEEGNPGRKANGRYSVVEWRDWAVARGKTAGDFSGGSEELKNNLLRAQVDKVEFQIKVLKGLYVSIEDVEKAGSELGQAVRKAVSQIHLIAPSLEGRSAIEISEALKVCEDDVLRNLHLLGSSIDVLKAPRVGAD